MSTVNANIPITTVAAGSGQSSGINLDIDTSDLSSSIQNIFTLVFGQEKAAAIAASGQLATFTAQIAPLAAGIINERIAGTGNSLVALAELRDVSVSMANQLFVDALYAQKAAIGQAVAGLLDGLATFAAKAAIIAIG